MQCIALIDALYAWEPSDTIQAQHLNDMEHELHELIIVRLGRSRFDRHELRECRRRPPRRLVVIAAVTVKQADARILAANQPAPHAVLAPRTASQVLE